MRTTRWSRFGTASRHPLAIVVVGFALSVPIGNWFTHRLDEQQKQRDAITKRFDAARAATDDLTVAMAQYQMRLLHLLDQIVVQSHTSRFDDAARDYETAYANWVQRSAADQAIIEQVYQSVSAYSDIHNYFSGFEQVSTALDGCARLYLAVPDLRAGIEHADITCQRGPKTTFVMSRQAYELGFCIRAFVLTTRPDPNNDFLPAESRNDFLRTRIGVLKQACKPDASGFLHESP